MAKLQGSDGKHIEFYYASVQVPSSRWENFGKCAISCYLSDERRKGEGYRPDSANKHVLKGDENENEDTAA